MSETGNSRTLFDSPLIKRAIVDAFRKLDPRHQVRNPVMFTVWVGSLLTSGLFVQSLLGEGEAPAGFILAVSAWLWFTVLLRILPKRWPKVGTCRTPCRSATSAT